MTREATANQESGIRRQEPAVVNDRPRVEKLRCKGEQAAEISYKTISEWGGYHNPVLSTVVWRSGSTSEQDWRVGV